MLLGEGYGHGRGGVFRSVAGGGGDFPGGACVVSLRTASQAGILQVVGLGVDGFRGISGFRRSDFAGRSGMDAYQDVSRFVRDALRFSPGSSAGVWRLEPGLSADAYAPLAQAGSRVGLGRGRVELWARLPMAGTTHRQLHLALRTAHARASRRVVLLYRNLFQAMAQEPLLGGRPQWRFLPSLRHQSRPLWRVLDPPAHRRPRCAPPPRP